MLVTTKGGHAMLWVVLIFSVFLLFMAFIAGLIVGTVYGPEIADGLIQAMRYIGLGE